MLRKDLIEKYSEEISRIYKLTGFDCDVSLDIIFACAKGEKETAHSKTKKLVNVFNKEFDYNTFLEDYKNINGI